MARALGDAVRPLAARVAVVISALAILYWRTPNTFTHPQFWAEDRLFFQESRLYGWESLPLSAGWTGYLGLAQVLVAHLANCFDPEFAGAIFCYSAVLLTLAVVCLAMSPRLDLPAKPLLALAIVIVPMGYEELGALCNIQWILPIGAFLLTFMRPSLSRLVLWAEALFLGITALSGPFALFLTPLFMWQIHGAGEAAARHRLLLLTAVCGLGALIQLWFITHHPGGGMDAGAPAPYPWTLWINLPFQRWMTDFGPASEIFQGKFGPVTGIFGLAAAALLAWLPPFRTQKRFILFFATAIAFTGMYKFHSALDTQIQATRYFYAGSVLLFPFICCLSNHGFMRGILFAFAALSELALLPAIHDSSRDVTDLEWPVWASYINSGLPVVIPTSPAGAAVILPAAKTGPLHHFAAWEGHNINGLAKIAPASSCAGYLNPGDRIIVTDLSLRSGLYNAFARWVVSGTAWDASVNEQARLVVIVDAAGTVIGFGLPGFRPRDESGQSPPEWRSIFESPAGATVHAYAVLNAGESLCPLANRQYLNEAYPPMDEPQVARGFYRAVSIMPGAGITQSFHPTHPLRAVSLLFVTYGRRPSRYDINWRITAIATGKSVDLGHGRIDAHALTDWGRVELPVALVPQQIPDQITITFWSDAKTIPAAPAGFPLYRPSSGDNDPPVRSGGIAAPDGAQLDFLVTYLQ